MSARIRIPGIAYVIAGVAVALLIALVAPEVVRHRELEGRAAAADSTAHVRLLEATILRRDVRAAKARADSAMHRADSLELLAAARRTDVRTKAAKAAASSALVDFSTLPEEVLQALVDADDFRVAVTPALAADSAAIAELHAVVRVKTMTIALQDSALIAQDGALAAQRVEIAALTRRAHPRCGRRCGAVIAGVALETLHQLPRILRWLSPPPRD